MTFIMPQKVKFKHCDPAGIVFYPRYFEMINDCIEAFFDEALNAPFEELHRAAAVPTAQISVTFVKPSYHGDRLRLSLACTSLGRSSLALSVSGDSGTENRFKATSTLVHVDAVGRATPWPERLRERLSEHLERAAA